MLSYLLGFALFMLIMIEAFGRIMNKKGLGVKAGKWIIKSLIKFLAMLLKEGGKALSKLAKSIK